MVGWITERQMDILSSALATARGDRSGHLPLETVQDLHDSLTHLGCHVRSRYGEGSEYITNKRADHPVGIIYYDISEPDFIQKRQLIHEGIHHTLHWFPPKLDWDNQTSLSDIGDARMVEELICSTAEDVAFPLPDHIQRNGKLAAPPSRPVVWCHPRRQIPGCMSIPADEWAQIDQHDEAEAEQQR